MDNFIVATVKQWNIDNFNNTIDNSSGNWTLVTDKKDLSIERVKKINPKYIFFPHWNWIIPDEIVNNFNCVCFHMTDVPYGRGGSPLQNLIVRGHEETKLTALKMEAELDAGPVFLKKDLNLDGTAQEIFERASELVFKSIIEICEKNPVPLSQVGEVTSFRRRKPEDGDLNKCQTLKEVFNYIRMLDADTYPKSFMETDLFKIEFHDAEDNGDKITARVVIKRKNSL